jgi:hypothetical protein
MGEMRNVYKIIIRKPEENNHLGDLEVDEMVILKRCSELLTGMKGMGMCMCMCMGM